MSSGKFTASAVLIVLAVVFGLTIGLGSFYVVPEGYRAVVTRNGRVVGIGNPGLNWKTPMIESTTDMSIQTQAASFDNIAAYSKDIQQATNQVTVNYRLSEGSVLQMYSTVGVNYVDVLLTNRILKHTKETFGRYIATDIINHRDKVSDEIEAALQADTAPLGIVVEDVQIANIDFSDAYEHAAEEAATAQARVAKAKQELAKIQVDAQQKVAQAEADAQATKLSADANAYSTKARGEADGEALRLRGEGEAAALKAKNQALADNPQLVQLILAERWQGNVPTTMTPNSAIPFLNVQP